MKCVNKLFTHTHSHVRSPAAVVKPRIKVCDAFLGPWMFIRNVGVVTVTLDLNVLWCLVRKNRVSEGRFVSVARLLVTKLAEAAKPVSLQYTQIHTHTHSYCKRQGLSARCIRFIIMLLGSYDR